NLTAWGPCGARTRGAAKGSQPGASGPSVIRRISSSVRPTALPMITCCPHSYSARQRPPVLKRRIARLRTARCRSHDEHRAIPRGHRRLDQDVVRENQPPLEELRVPDERPEDV